VTFMILQALYRYYELLEERGESLPGEAYSEAYVSFEIQLDQNGRVLAILPYTNEKGRTIKKKYYVPKQPHRTSNTLPFFLCDKAEYLFGEAIGMREARRISMRDFWLDILDKTEFETEEIRALRAFVSMDSTKLKSDIEHATQPNVIESLKRGDLCVLKYAPNGKLFHQIPEIKLAWETKFYSESEGLDTNPLYTCLITGKRVPKNLLARTHPQFKKVAGAQSSGASLVSFNEEAFRSYGLEQSYNAPTSQQAAEAYGLVLNRFLADPAHKVRLNDTTVVFWTESNEPREQEFLASLLQEAPADNREPDREDSVTARIRSAIVRIREGRTFRETFADLNPDTRFYVLGLSPNAARLAVRFWYTGSLGEIGERVWQHYADLLVQGLDHSPSIRALLRELALQGDLANLPPQLEGQLLRSILLGQPYPRSVFAQLMNRIRADDASRKLNPRRAALIKGYFIRQARRHQNQAMEANLTMTLHEDSTSTAYHLGRLFACLEKTQKDAHENQLNATITDRYWGAASATPALVFPRLLHLARHHISKDEKWGRRNDDLIQQVMSKLPTSFPARLTLEEQGMFALGYYHQRQEFYTSKSDKQSQN